MTSKAQATKEKLDEENFVKTENCCLLKETIKSKKSNPWNRRKYLQIISDKGLISRIYGEPPKLINNKTQFKDGQMRSSRHGAVVNESD